MFNRTLFEIAFASESGPGVGSMALLALRRFFWRSLKQVGQISAGLLSLFLIVGVAAHSPVPTDTPPAKTTPPKTMSMSMPHRLSTQPSNPSRDSTVSSPNSRLSTPLAGKGKPFQTLRPKMTHHRLTTSRFSIPAGRAQSAGILPENE